VRLQAEDLHEDVLKIFKVSYDYYSWLFLTASLPFPVLYTDDPVRPTVVTHFETEAEEGYSYYKPSLLTAFSPGNLKTFLLLHRMGLSSIKQHRWDQAALFKVVATWQASLRGGAAPRQSIENTGVKIHRYSQTIHHLDQANLELELRATQCALQA
jgi:hypothetical protein